MNGWKGACYSLLGMAVTILIFLPFSSNHFKLFGFHGIKIIGMGDVKLFGYLGALFCLPGILKIIVVTYVLGGVCSLILMLYKRILVKRLMYFITWLGGYAKTYGNKEYVSAMKIKFAPFAFFAVCGYCLYQWIC